jgi:hypothetical protein
MRGSPALQAFRRTVTVDWKKGMEADAKALLIRTARQGHAEIMRRQGNPAFEVYANRPGNTNIESVVLPGPIVYKYSNIKSIVEVALDELRKASPVVSGDYVRSHMLFVNGVAVNVLPETVKPSDEIMIANPVPYARKIEIGKTKTGRDFVVQVPNRIYERVAKSALIPRYRNVAAITFGYVTLPDAYRYKKDNAARSWLAAKGRWYVSPKQRKDRVKGAVVQSPAIFISQIT